MIKEFRGADRETEKEPSKWFQGDLHELLARRKKHSKITDEQRRYLRDLFGIYPNSCKAICRKYKISLTTFKSIQKEAKDSCEAKNYRIDRLLREKSQKEDLIRTVEKYVAPPKKPLTLKQIKDNILEKEGLEITVSKIRRILKEKLGYTYRLGCRRVPKSQSRRNKLIKTLFCTEFLDMVYSGKVLLNVDESSFDRSVAQRYTWLPKKGSKVMIDKSPQGKCSLVLMTASNGLWFSYIQPGTMKAADFSRFFLIMDEVLINSGIHKKAELVITLDNARTHTAELSKTFQDSITSKMFFMPPYCSEVAPVERIFGIVKSRMKQDPEYSTLNFDKKAGARKIAQLLHEIDIDSWKKSWISAIKEAKADIIANR